MRAKSFTVLSLIGVLASATAVPNTAPEALVIREESKGNDGDFAAAACRCIRVSDPGLYCGFCRVAPGTGVGPGNNWVNDVALDNVAWCNTAGGCEDYGYSTHCANREARGCIGIDRW